MYAKLHRYRSASRALDSGGSEPATLQSVALLFARLSLVGRPLLRVAVCTVQGLDPAQARHSLATAPQGRARPFAELAASPSKQVGPRKLLGRMVRPPLIGFIPETLAALVESARQHHESDDCRA
jgi:hypothetical protein